MPALILPVAHGAKRKEDATAPDAQNCFTVALFLNAQLHQIIEHRPCDQGIQAIAYLNIGRRFIGFRINLHPNRVIRSSGHNIVKICAKSERLLVSGAGRLHLYRSKGSILDLNAAFFHRCFEPEIARFVAFQDRGEQLDHGLAVDRRSLVMPGAVARDAHIDVAAEIFRLRSVFRAILWMVAVKTV